MITVLRRQPETIPCLPEPTRWDVHHTPTVQQEGCPITLAYLRVSVTDPSSTGLQGMTATIRKLEHQLQPDGNILLPEYEDGQLLLRCTVGRCTAATGCCHWWWAVSKALSWLTSLQKSSSSSPKKRRCKAQPSFICTSTKVAWGAYKLKVVCVKSCGCHRDNWFVPAVVDGYQADERRQDNMPSVV